MPISNLKTSYDYILSHNRAYKIKSFKYDVLLFICHVFKTVTVHLQFAFVTVTVHLQFEFFRKDYKVSF